MNEGIYECYVHIIFTCPIILSPIFWQQYLKFLILYILLMEA